MKYSRIRKISRLQWKERKYKGWILGTDPPNAFTYLRKPASAAPACANLLAIREECGRSPTRQDSFTRNRSAGFR